MWAGIGFLLASAACRSPEQQFPSIPGTHVAVKSEFEPLLGPTSTLSIKLHQLETATGKGDLALAHILPSEFQLYGNLADGARMVFELQDGRTHESRTSSAVAYLDPVAVDYAWFGQCGTRVPIRSVTLTDSKGRVLGKVNHKAENPKLDRLPWVYSHPNDVSRWELYIPGLGHPFRQSALFRVEGERSWRTLISFNNDLREVAGKRVEVALIVSNGLQPRELHYIADFTGVKSTSR